MHTSAPPPPPHGHCSHEAANNDTLLTLVPELSYLTCWLLRFKRENTKLVETTFFSLHLVTAE
jgi:hypothetical protein